MNRSGRGCGYTNYINQTADRKVITAYYNFLGVCCHHKTEAFLSVQTENV